MSPEQFQLQFSSDVEFRRLLSRDNSVDVVKAALELARDESPALNFGRTLQWIAQRTEELRPAMVRMKTAADSLQLLADCLAGTHGLTGEAACHHRADGSYLDRVIISRRGIPISLSILYVAVAEQLGLPCFGIGAPAHFLVGCETNDGLLILDAYSAGRILTRDDATQWLSDLTGWQQDAIDETLRPATPREIILRMLNNLKRVHIQNDHWLSALKVQQRLSALQPSDYEERRDLAVIALRAGRAGMALNDIERCLSSCPPEEREKLVQQWNAAKSQIAATN